VPPNPPTPSFSATSPVATASARILSAYLSRNKLSPAETASLSAAITSAVAALAAGTIPSASTIARAAEPVPNGRAAKVPKPRVPRRRLQAVADEQAEFDLGDDDEKADDVAGLTALEPEPEAVPATEPEPAPVAEPALSEAPEPALLSEPETFREPEPALAAEPESELELGFELEAATEIGLLTSLPKKRKRPSRPRSKRGAAKAAGRLEGDASAEALSEAGVDEAAQPIEPPVETVTVVDVAPVVQPATYAEADERAAAPAKRKPAKGRGRRAESS